MWDAIVTPEEGNLPQPHCPNCDMFIPWTALNHRHSETALCVWVVERKQRRLAEKEAKGGGVVRFPLRHTTIPWNGVLVPIPGPDTDGGRRRLAIHYNKTLKVTEGVGPPLMDPGDRGSKCEDAGLLLHRRCPVNPVIWDV